MFIMRGHRIACLDGPRLGLVGLFREHAMPPLESCYPATETLTCVRRQGIGRSFVIAVGEDERSSLVVPERMWRCCCSVDDSSNMMKLKIGFELVWRGRDASQDSDCSDPRDV